MSWREKLNIKPPSEQLEPFRLSASKEKKLKYCKDMKSMKSSFSLAKDQKPQFSSHKILTFEPLKLNFPQPNSLKDIQISFKDHKHPVKNFKGGVQLKKNSQQKSRQIQNSSVSSSRSKFDNFPVFNLSKTKVPQLLNFTQKKNLYSLKNSKSQKQILKPPLIKCQDPFFSQQPLCLQKNHQRSMTTFEVKTQKVIDQKKIDFNDLDLSQLLKSLRTTANSKKKQSNSKSKLPQRINDKPLKKQMSIDEFYVGKTLGKGQYGQVKFVRHKQTGFICALKIMNKNTIKQYNYVSQVAREIGIQSYLNHRNIAPLYGYFDDKQNLYLLVEYCEGGQLYQQIKKQSKIKQQKVSKMMKQVIEGLDYLHKLQIIHRDLKPQNILFNLGVPKISDFGWAVFHNQQSRKTTSGSPLYYAPQIVKGESYDEKMDLWNIGMMTYECVLGKIPFRIYSELDLGRIVSDEIKFPSYLQVSEETKDFILKIMKKDPQERMQIREMFRHQFIKQHQQKLDPMLQSQINKIIK